MNKKYLFLIAILFVGVISLKAQKIDTIFHINGNVMTGDFYKMVYGVVTWKMDGMGTISLETPKINTVKSTKQFEVKLKNGMTYFGTIDSSGIFKHLNINISNSRELIAIEQIVEIYPIKRNFWLRTSGNFGLGINYSKGSDLATISFTGNIDYRKKNSYFYINWDDYNTYQSDTLSSTKADATIGWQRLLKKKWSIGTSVGINQNSELGTKMRLNLVVTGIYDIVYNNWNRFFAAAGLSAQRETPFDTSGISNDLAGSFGIYWKVFKLTNPKIWVDADVTWIPYLTTDGRNRLNINLNPKVGLIGNDLKLGLMSYYTYDSKPQSTEGANDDWGIALEISYSFH